MVCPVNNIEDVFTGDRNLIASSKDEIRDNVDLFIETINNGYIIDNEIFKFIRLFLTKNNYRKGDFCDAAKYDK